jgi:hypothetical protein
MSAGRVGEPQLTGIEAGRVITGGVVSLTEIS